MALGIRATLLARIDRYRNRYKGDLPKELPVTLDEWAWITEELIGSAKIDIARFEGIELVLVEDVFDAADGGIVVRR